MPKSKSDSASSASPYVRCDRVHLVICHDAIGCVYEPLVQVSLASMPATGATVSVTWSCAALLMLVSSMPLSRRRAPCDKATTRTHMHALLCAHVHHVSALALQKKVWYHQGPEELYHVRVWTARYSLARFACMSAAFVCSWNGGRARDRLKAARITLAQPDNSKVNRQMLHQKLQVCLARDIVCCAIEHVIADVRHSGHADGRHSAADVLRIQPRR